MIKAILFVCTGSTCRHPMAEHLFEKLLLDYKLEDQVQARSAGIPLGLREALIYGHAYG